MENLIVEPIDTVIISENDEYDDFGDLIAF